ncbi:MAG: bifunctional oligoribonuclease/PAP phosphatase NrnA [Phycisphaerales bacterium]|nr:bifunctional oligoribonuclease/PAP phosphatase NrnA [Phycisphaerales bacterium]
MEVERWSSVTRRLRSIGRVAVVTHQRPDGDALGSAAGAVGGLRKLGVEATVTLFEPPPARYAFLLDSCGWQAWSDFDPKRYGAIVVLDTNARGQLVPMVETLDTLPPITVIDHHVSPPDVGMREIDLCLIDAQASATALLIAEWFAAADIPLDAPTATALFTGLATDTGWFRFPSVDARTLAVATRLVEAGAQPSEIFERLYQQEPIERLRLVARMLNRLELRANGRLAVMTLRREDFERTGATGGMTEDLVNEAGKLAGVEATVLLTESDDGVVRVNFRSRGQLDVASLAGQFGGGGHFRASGARVSGDFDAVTARVVDAAVAALG